MLGFLLALFLTASVALPALAQPPWLDGESEIRHLPGPGLVTKLDLFRCGDYFVFQENPPAFPRGARTGYVLEPRADDPRIAEREITLAGAFLKRKLKR